MQSTTFLALVACAVTAWLFRASTRSNGFVTEALLLAHSAYILYYILVDPPRNIFSELRVPPDTSPDSLKALLIRASEDGSLTEDLERLLKKLNSFDMRVLYSQCV